MSERGHPCLHFQVVTRLVAFVFAHMSTLPPIPSESPTPPPLPLPPPPLSVQTCILLLHPVSFVAVHNSAHLLRCILLDIITHSASPLGALPFLKCHCRSYRATGPSLGRCSKQEREPRREPMSGATRRTRAQTRNLRARALGPGERMQARCVASYNNRRLRRLGPAAQARGTYENPPTYQNPGPCHFNPTPH